MDTDNISKQINKLPIIESDSFFLIYQPTMSKEYAKKLVGKTIYFTWHHTIFDYINNEAKYIYEETSGKVLEYRDTKLLIYTDYVLMLEEDLKNSSDIKDNQFIQEILLDDISNIAEFNDYKFEGWEIIPDDYCGNIYELTNMQNDSITAITYDFDGLYLYLIYKQKENEISRNKYPINLIKNMKLI